MLHKLCLQIHHLSLINKFISASNFTKTNSEIVLCNYINFLLPIKCRQILLIF